MNILALTRYSRNLASSRYRFFNFYETLENKPISISTCPFFDVSYQDRIYEGKIQYLFMFKQYIKRVIALINSAKYDVVWLEKEFLPWIPHFFEAMLCSGMNYIVDFDDAWFHRYDSHGNRFIRYMLRGKISSIMKNAKCVICGNEYIANYARKAGAKQVKVIPTVIDLKQYSVKNTEDNGKVIGWIGTPKTAKYLDILKPVLVSMEKKGAKIVVVGGGDYAKEITPNVIVKKWTEETEVECLKSFDIGIMPLPSTPFEEGKCGLKLLQYMGVGIPVVASPVGVNQDIVNEGINGFKADNLQHWENAFTHLLDNLDSRKEMGRNGRRMVEENYSISAVSGELLEVLTS